MQLITAVDAVRLFRPLLVSRRAERALIAHLRSDRNVIAVDAMSGSCDAVDLPLREIVAQAIRYGTRSLILAHNHPSGDPRPSEGDLSATRRLTAVAADIGVGFDDHLIFAGERCVSLRALGLL